jgi:TPR repeat protein
MFRIFPLLIALTLGPALVGCAAETNKRTVPADKTAAPALQALTIAELEARMGKGDLRAQAELAARYGRGDGVPADVAKAIALLKDAVAKNEPDAMHWLATAYTNGVGVEKNATQAALLYEQAALKGHRESQFIMGVTISTGQAGFSADWKAAIPYFRRSADQNLPMAEFMMGYAYQQGYGVETHPETAAYWYRRALSRGPHINAQFNLARMIGQNLVKALPGDPDPVRDLTEADILATANGGK